MHYQTHTMPDGLRIVHMPITGNVSYCGFFINAGTRDEDESEFGMAHFVEHMLFKGTNKRRAHHIINRMENVGGELNAYTNKEETVIYSVYLEEHCSRAIELLSDLVFNSQFPSHEIEKERDVIIDEIHSYEDSPSELIFDDFENLIFKASQFGHNILGTPDSLATFDSDKISRFVTRQYHPSNMVFFSIGSTSFKKIFRLCEKHIPYRTDVNTNRQRTEPSPVDRISQTLQKDTSQAHALIGGRSYSIFDPKYKALLLLNNILGGPGMNSRLNISLREKKGYVYNVESSVTGYTDTGMTAIYFGCDKNDVQACLNLVNKELKKLRDSTLSSTQLAAAKKQFIGQIGISTDNHENLALSLGKSIFHFNSYDTLPQTFEKINRITASEIKEVANEIFAENNLSSLIYN